MERNSMIMTKSKIDDKIEVLEQQLLSVKGRETEKYARIVGYYRAVKNWNKGKKEEYKFRVNFSETIFNNELNGSMNDKNQNDSSKKSVKKSKTKALGNIKSYKFFFRTTCPNCPPVKAIINNLELTGESINADSSKGFTKAAIFEIFTAPTVVFLNDKGVEVARASNAVDLNAIISDKNIS